MLLSVCIPTHTGRAQFLRRAVESVAVQVPEPLQDTVDICISDNASIDETAEVVAELQAVPGPRISYFRNESDIGSVRNILAVVERATGSFCWLLGSDDTVSAGAIAEVLRILEDYSNTSGMTVNRQRFDYRWPDLVRSDPPDELPDDSERLHVYESADEALANCGLAHDYMSAQIVSRAVWLDAAASLGEARITETMLGPLHVIGAMIQREPRWIWHPARLVTHRTGTSDLDEELGHDYSGYQLRLMGWRSSIWSELFGKGTPTYRALMTKAYHRSANTYTLARYKLVPGHSLRRDVELLMAMVRHFYWLPDFWLHSFAILLVPYPLIGPIRSVAARLDRRLGRPPGANRL